MRPETLECCVLPLAFATQNEYLSADSELRLVDLGSHNQFGIFRDNSEFLVKRLVSQDGNLSMESVSQFDFGHVGASERGNEKVQKPVSAIVPLNRTDAILVTLAHQKRYLIYDYISGEVLKEIQPLRGFDFKACSGNFDFSFEHKPEIMVFNESTVRRVDIQTFEIKKSIDVTRLLSQRGI
jgi:hypothetical protein